MANLPSGIISRTACAITCEALCRTRNKWLSLYSSDMLPPQLAQIKQKNLPSQGTRGWISRGSTHIRQARLTGWLPHFIAVTGTPGPEYWFVPQIALGGFWLFCLGESFQSVALSPWLATNSYSSRSTLCSSLSLLNHLRKIFFFR